MEDAVRTLSKTWDVTVNHVAQKSAHQKEKRSLEQHFWRYSEPETKKIQQVLCLVLDISQDSPIKLISRSFGPYNQYPNGVVITPQ